MRTSHLIPALALLAVQVSASSNARPRGRVNRSLQLGIQLDNPLAALARFQNSPSSVPCMSGVSDPERADNCCQGRVYTPNGSQQEACCPANSVYSSTSLPPSCCGPNEQSDVTGQCCGFTSSGQSIDAYCSTSTDGCCPADKPNSDGATCCSNEDYTESSGTCCPDGAPAVNGVCCLGTVNQDLFGNKLCCTDGQDFHSTPSGGMCCASDNFDTVNQVCGDGSYGSICNANNPCLDYDTTCTDDGTGTSQTRCIVTNSSPTRQKVKRGSVDEKPVQFKKTGTRRLLLRKDQAVDMIANQGTFYYDNKLIYDPTFMPKRSRWSKSYSAAVKTLTAWKPDVLANRAYKLFQHPSGQIALSANFKMQSSDGIWVIRELVDSPTFVDFDYNWITINKDGLEALANKLESKGNATMVAESKLRGRDL